jgi:hypothetical protein
VRSHPGAAAKIYNRGRGGFLYQIEVAGFLSNGSALLGTSNRAFALEIVIDLAKKRWAAVEFDLRGTKLGTISGTTK